MKSSKTFAQQFNETMNATMSAKDKIAALIKIGLPERMATQYVGAYAKNTGNGAIYTFGVELEMQCSYHRVLSRNNGIKFEAQGYNHIDSREVFKFVRDASLVGADSIECVSPILNGTTDGFDTLKKACEAVNAQGAAVNKSCGFHVHVGAADLTDEQYVNVFVNYQMLEELIDSFMAPSRRGNTSRWCHSLQSRHLSACETKRDVLRELDYDRYFKVNPCAYERHQTIEFRQHQGTTDYEKISNWVKFCIALVDFSKSHRLTSKVMNIDDIKFMDDDVKAFFKARKAHFAA